MATKPGSITTEDKKALRPELLKIWKFNKKIASIQGERDVLIAQLKGQYGNNQLEEAYKEFETGVF